MEIPEWFLLPIFSYINNTQPYSLYRKLGLQAIKFHLIMVLISFSPEKVTNGWHFFCVSFQIFFLSVIYIYVELYNIICNEIYNIM